MARGGAVLHAARSSARLRAFHLHGQRLTPLRAKGRWRIRVTLLKERSGYHTVGAEAAKVSPQLAPGDEHAGDLRVADGDRPDHALRHRALLVFVFERDLLTGADRGAQRRHVDRVGA